MDTQKHTQPQSDLQPAPAPKHNKMIIWIAVAVIAAAAIAVVVFVLAQQSAKQTNTDTQKPERARNTSSFVQQYGSTCKERDVSFTSPPMRMQDLAFIRPLGAMSDGHVTPTDHVYIGGPNPNAADNTYPVLMPADGTIVEVGAMPAQYIGDRSDQQTATEDHRLVISFSCRYFAIYIHIHKLSDPLKAAVGDLQPNQNKQVSVELKAGDTVGYIGNSTFDWTPIDTSVELPGFITPALYASESWKIHTVSPFDLYQGTLKSELEAKSLRTVPPIGGKIDYDQPGTLLGNWFGQGTNGYQGNSQTGEGRYWDGHLSVVPDYIDPTSTIVSIGNWTGSAQQFVVSGVVDPAKVTKASGMVKYELKKLNYVTGQNTAWTGSSWVAGIHPAQNNSVEGTIALQVLDGEKLQVEKFPGKTPAQVTGFTSAMQTYER